MPSAQSAPVQPSLLVACPCPHMRFPGARNRFDYHQLHNRSPVASAQHPHLRKSAQNRCSKYTIRCIRTLRRLENAPHPRPTPLPAPCTHSATCTSPPTSQSAHLCAIRDACSFPGITFCVRLRSPGRAHASQLLAPRAYTQSGSRTRAPTSRPAYAYAARTRPAT